MKSMYLTFEDKDFKKLEDAKINFIDQQEVGKISWEKFFLELAKDFNGD